MHRLFRPLTESSGRIAGAYLLFGAVWIVVTDELARSVATSPAALSRLQTAKGWAFVLASAGLLLVLLHTRERRLAAEREFTDLALGSLRDIFVVLDPAGVIQRVNREAVEVTGYSESELLGMDAAEAFGLTDRDRIEAGIANAIEGLQDPVRATLVTMAGSRLQYEFRGRRMVDEAGEVRGIVVIGRDITDQLLNEQRLAVALRVLRHNIRNDLNVIRGWAESIVGGDGQATVREKIIVTVDKLLSISEKTRRMADLGEPTGHGPREINVVERVRAIVDEFGATHPEATIELELPADAGDVRTEGYQLEVAMRNAIENAIVHNLAEAPWARVSIRQDSAGRAIVVEDDGPGIPDTERLALEEGYETPLEHGSGVGLWMIQWCLRDLGGSVRLCDRDPTGTEISLELPPRTSAA